MARFAISEEGAEAMSQLSNNIRNAYDGLKQAGVSLKSSILGSMDDLGNYGIEIWSLALNFSGILDDNEENFTALAEAARKKSEEIRQLIGLNTSSGIGSSSSNNKTVTRQTIQDISSWLKEINPNYYNPFIPARNNPYHVNCGSCAFAVENRLQGNTDIVATDKNIGTDAGMEAATGKKCVYMDVNDIAQRLINMGPGSHLICGINRNRGPGHWFNAFYDGKKVYTIDGQTGEVYDWPHDYCDVAEWCALV